MLVLTRKPNEKIILNDGATKIEITICQITGNKVRVGIEAPASVRVDREEIHEIRTGRATA